MIAYSFDDRRGDKGRRRRREAKVNGMRSLRRLQGEAKVQQQREGQFLFLCGLFRAHTKGVSRHIYTCFKIQHRVCDKPRFLAGELPASERAKVETYTEPRRPPTQPPQCAFYIFILPPPLPFNPSSPAPAFHLSTIKSHALRLIGLNMIAILC